MDGGARLTVKISNHIAHYKRLILAEVSLNHYRSSHDPKIWSSDNEVDTQYCYSFLWVRWSEYLVWDSTHYAARPFEGNLFSSKRANRGLKLRKQPSNVTSSLTRLPLERLRSLAVLEIDLEGYQRS